MRVDVVVLGAGIVGASTAAQLALRGAVVALVDRRDAGEETSYGNAGVVECSGVPPAAFPRDLATLARAALGRLPHVRYHWGALPGLLPFLWRYHRASTAANLAQATERLYPLLHGAVAEHRALLAAARREDLLRPTGWLKLFRSARGFDRHVATDLPVKTKLGFAHRILEPDAAMALEPALRPVFHRAVWWTDPLAATPGEVTKVIADLVPRHGGLVLRGEARSLQTVKTGFAVRTVGGVIEAPQAVVALGPWSTDVTERFGLRLPFAVKRGYHRHYAHPPGGIRLARPVLDMEGGYVLAPMPAGLRLTTGVEFAKRDAPPTPVQLAMVEPLAAGLVGLGPPVEAEPWMGRRPCLPDMLPVIGQMPGVPGLWLAFGHHHLGFTLGPVTGRLVADLVRGAAPPVDPAPYRAERFA